MESRSSGKTGGRKLMSFAIGVIVGVFFGVFFLALVSKDKEQ